MYNSKVERYVVFGIKFLIAQKSGLGSIAGLSNNEEPNKGRDWAKLGAE